ncbi:MAG: helix-turn-helix transcriptional regulator [Pseudomonadota bacterium]|nr:helix-turn-helix transcriptional regulator [Pseudomonadota bacterium]
MPLDQLASALQLWMCHIIGVEKRTGTLMFSHEGGPSPAAVPLDYLRTYHDVNPRIAPALALGEQEWLHCHELFPETFVANDRFYQEYLIPYGGRYLSGTKIIDDDHLLVLFATLRPVGTRPLDRDEVAVLHRIKQHLTSAFRIHQHLRETYAELQVGRDVLNEFAYPMVMVDEHRNLRLNNAAAAGALSATDYIVNRGGVLGCRDPRDDRELTIAIHELQLHAASPATRTPRMCIRLQRASSGASVAVFLSRMQPSTAMKAFGHQPLALLIFHDTGQSTCFDPLLIAEMFDLTPAEARISVRLAAGASLSHIAKEAHVSQSTVRTQMKAIMAKLDVHRQSDLVRILLSLPDLPWLRKNR